MLPFLIVHTVGVVPDANMRDCISDFPWKRCDIAVFTAEGVLSHGDCAQTSQQPQLQYRYGPLYPAPSSSFLSVPLFTHRPLYPAPPSSFLSVPLFTHRPLYPAPPFIPLSSFVHPQATLPSTTLFIPLSFFVHPQATLPSTTLFIPLFLCSPTGHFT